ncbi:MAG: UvrD-helicase domain-containing protein [bacterium]
MKFIGDFHIHSHYSIATSKKLIPEYLDAWAQIKGVKVLGTGDFIHPGWLAELKEKLEPAEDGLFKLKPEYKLKDNEFYVPPACRQDVRFVLTGELSSIYKKNNRTRKVHNLIFAPSFASAEKIQSTLDKIGNIRSDGRPILGLDSKRVLEIVLESDTNSFLIPAHIWTPWFSVLGSKSGFDSIEECFEDLAPYIFAVETGLSSDPDMNRMCSFLDKYTLISNSDAHSPEKIGREANLFNTELNYPAIRDAIKNKDAGFLGTIEFFPQEGKYHYDGHRKCGVNMNPLETLKNDGICPDCGREVTVGVLNRVVQLADRDPGDIPFSVPFHSITSLASLLAEVLNVNESSKKVKDGYHSLIQKGGSEFHILLNLPLEDVKLAGGEIVAEGIRRMRNKEAIVQRGYDGEFGRIRFFGKNEKEILRVGTGLFASPETEHLPHIVKTVDFSIKEYKKMFGEKHAEIRKDKNAKSADTVNVLNKEQQKAVSHYRGPCLIIAGPGTGKTFTLTNRIANLIEEYKTAPENILALTFTNKAAGQMQDRLRKILRNEDVSGRITISTFHALGLDILKEHADMFDRNPGFLIFSDAEKKFILTRKLGVSRKELKSYTQAITLAKQQLNEPDEAKMRKIYSEYESVLQKENAFDIDDLISCPVRLLEKNINLQTKYQQRFVWICVDEYQDINYAQYRFISALAPDTDSNICVIGDPNQAIYGFRGADSGFIKQFSMNYPKAQIYRLQQSYRCSENILRASGQIINTQAEDSLKGIQAGLRITIHETETGRAEADYIGRTISQMIGGTNFFSLDSAVADGEKHTDIESLSDFAVLFRLTQQADLIAEALNNYQIPYQIISTDNPLRDHWIVNFLKLSQNPANTIFAEYIIKQLQLKPEQAGEVQKIANACKTLSAHEAIDKITAKYGGDNDDLEEIYYLAKKYDNNTARLIRYIVLGSGVDLYQEKSEHVSLMTLHAAKGLEFKCVFIPGCEEGVLPYTWFGEDKCDIAEEKRLLYVGMTRARKILYLTNAKQRKLFGMQRSLKHSPFIDNIEKDLLEIAQARKGKKKIQTTNDDQLSFF